MTVKPFLAQIAHSVNEMHRLRLVHRDIKPDNIFITGSPPECRLGDFNTAREVDMSNNFKLEVNETINTTVVGSGYFKSPEMINEKPNGSQTDVWSFGITIGVIIGLDDNLCPPGYHGGLPGYIRDCAAGKHDLWLHQQGIYLSPIFQHLIKNCLMIDPARRFTMQQVIDHPFV